MNYGINNGERIHGLKSTDICLDVMGGKAEFLPSAIREKCVPFTEIVNTGKGSYLEENFFGHICF